MTQQVGVAGAGVALTALSISGNDRCLRADDGASLVEKSGAAVEKNAKLGPTSPLHRAVRPTMSYTYGLGGAGSALAVVGACTFGQNGRCLPPLASNPG